MSHLEGSQLVKLFLYQLCFVFGHVKLFLYQLCFVFGQCTVKY